MTSHVTVLHKDGAVELMEWNQSADELAPYMRAYLDAADLANDGPRGATQAAADLQVAIDELREATSLKFDNLDHFAKFVDRMTKALDNARRAQREAGAA